MTLHGYRVCKKIFKVIIHFIHFCIIFVCQYGKTKNSKRTQQVTDYSYRRHSGASGKPKRTHRMGV